MSEANERGFSFKGCWSKPFSHDHYLILFCGRVRDDCLSPINGHIQAYRPTAPCVSTGSINLLRDEVETQAGNQAPIACHSLHANPGCWYMIPSPFLRSSGRIDEES